MGKKSKEYGYLKNWENFFFSMKKAIRENHGQFPLGYQLREMGYGNLNYAIQRLHGGFNSVRQKMGYEKLRIEKGYYKDRDVFEKDMRKAIRENHGKFPLQQRFIEMGYSALFCAIGRYHGGINAVRKKMGFKLVQNDRGHFKSWPVFEKELRRVIKENGGLFPTETQFGCMGCSGLAGAAYTYHGGLNAIRVRMGFAVVKRPNKYYEPWEVFEPDMRKAIKKNHGRFPTQKRLIELGYGRLVSAIKDYRGGLNTVRQKMGFNIIKRSNGYYKPWEVFEPDMSAAIKENDGRFPTQIRLFELGHGELAGAITKYHGGIAAVREKIGYGISQKPKGYWKVWKNAKKELTEAILENDGTFPTQRRLYNLGRGSLACAIQIYHGGMAAVRERIGYNEQVRIKLARQLEEIADQVAA